MAYLVHHGIKGQKWGIRRFQNEDGTLTTAGRKRYGYGDLIETFDNLRDIGTKKGPEPNRKLPIGTKKGPEPNRKLPIGTRTAVSNHGTKNKRPSKAKEFTKDFVEGNAEVAINNAKRFAKGVAGLAAARLGTYAVSKGTQFYWTMAAATHSPMYQTVDNLFGSKRKKNPPNTFNAKRSEYTIV